MKGWPENGERKDVAVTNLRVVGVGLRHIGDVGGVKRGNWRLLEGKVVVMC